MATLYTDLYVRESELPPQVRAVLGEEAVPAVWTDGEGGVEERYEVHEIPGLQKALQEAFPHVDFGRVELLVVVRRE